MFYGYGYGGAEDGQDQWRPRRPNPLDAVQGLRQRLADRQTVMPVSEMPALPEPAQQERSPWATAISTLGDLGAAAIKNRKPNPARPSTPPTAGTPPMPTRPQARPTLDESYGMAEPAPPVVTSGGVQYDNSAIGVPIPGIPRSGQGLKAYDPISKAEYDTAMSHARTERPIDPNDPSTFYQPLREKRSFKEILRNVGIGALQGAATGNIGGIIGGALAGGIAGGVSPELGRAYRFNSLQRPQMEADRNRALQEQLYRQQQISEYLKAQQSQAAMEKMQAETQKIQEETKGLPETARRKQAAEDVALKLQGQRLEAAERANSPEALARAAEKHQADLDWRRAEIRRADRLPASSEGAQKQPKPTTMPGNIFKEYGDVQNLRQKAMKAFRAINDPSSYEDLSSGPLGGLLGSSNKQTPEARKIELQLNAKIELEKYNQAARALSESYPHLFEGGAGVNPDGTPSEWRYIKPRNMENQ